MTYLSLTQKFKILFDVLLDFKGIFIFTILIMLFTILYGLKKISKKRYVISITLSLVLMFLISILSNIKILSNTFDNFMTIFFSGIYFPSIYVYIAMTVIIFISFITSILNRMIRKIYKIVNTIMFILNNIILTIILNIVAANNIDVFSPNSLFTNINLVAILELTTGLFILWTLIIVCIYFTNCIYGLIVSKKKKPIQENILSSDNVEITTNEEKTVCINKTNEITQEVINTNDEIKDNYVEIVKKDDIDSLLNVKAVYYDNNKNVSNYNIENPQEFYEKNYLNIKANFDDESSSNVVSEIKEDNYITAKDITNEIKLEKAKENTLVNTVSLNDLISVEEVVETEKDIKKIESITKDNEKYTLEDYKKILSMLKEIRNSNVKNITIDDAITLSLFKDNSIDDCLKFKEILKMNLD